MLTYTKNDGLSYTYIELKSISKPPQPLSKDKVKSGSFCLAPYFAQQGGDDCYYRARITNVFRPNRQQIQVEVKAPKILSPVIRRVLV